VPGGVVEAVFMVKLLEKGGVPIYVVKLHDAPAGSPPPHVIVTA